MDKDNSPLGSNYQHSNVRVPASTSMASSKMNSSKRQRGNTTSTRIKCIPTSPSTSIPGSASGQRDKHVCLWTHRDPNKLCLVPMDTTDPHGDIAQYLKDHYDKDPHSYNMATLVSGAEYAIPVMKHNMKLDQGILLCMPLFNITVHIHISDGPVFKEIINPLHMTMDLKAAVLKSKGYPKRNQELLYDRQVMCNHSLILDYKLTTGSKINLVLQPSKTFKIQVKTFWGMIYDMEVNPCMTVGQLLTNILHKTCSSSIGVTKKNRYFHQKSMFNHLTVLEHGKTHMDKGTCLNFYKIQKDSVVHLLSSSEERKDDTKTLQIVMNDQDSQEWSVQSAVYDTWFIVVLKVHGFTSVPIDRMTLTCNDRHIEHQCTIGVLKHDSHIRVKVTLVPDTEIILPQTTERLMLRIKLPSGVNENMYVASSDHVKDLKKKLVDQGYTDAVYYDIYYKRVRMLPLSKLEDFKLPTNTHLEAKLSDFPVYVTHNNHSFAITANARWCSQDLVQKIQDKLALTTSTYSIIYKGRNIDVQSNTFISLDKLGLHPNAKVYVQQREDSQELLLVSGSDSINITENIESLGAQQLGKLSPTPNSLLASIKWFLKWRYPGRFTTRGEKLEISSRIIPQPKFISRAALGMRIMSDPSYQHNIRPMMSRPHQNGTKHVNLPFALHDCNISKLGSSRSSKSPEGTHSHVSLKSSLKQRSHSSSTAAESHQTSGPKRRLSVRFNLPDTDNFYINTKQPQNTDYNLTNGSQSSPRDTETYSPYITSDKNCQPGNDITQTVQRHLSQHAVLQSNFCHKSRDWTTTFAKYHDCMAASDHTFRKEGMSTATFKTQNTMIKCYPLEKSKTSDIGSLHMTRTESESDDVFSYTLI